MADHALRMVSSVPLERRGNVNCIGFSPDGRNYAWGYDNGLIGVQRWRQIPTTIRANADSIFALGWAPDGESFVAGDGRGQLIFVNRSGQFRIEEVHEAPIWSLAFSPNGDFVLSGAADGTIGIFGKAMSYPVLMTGHLDDVTAVAWKPDGRQFASASYDQSVTIWNAPSWEKDAKLQIRSRVLDIDWAPDDRICVALEDGTIALVTLSPFSTRTFEGHTGAVDLVSCFARAPILISDSSDGTIRLWDIRTGGELIALRTEKTVGGNIAINEERSCIAIPNNKQHIISLWTFDSALLLPKHGDIITQSSAKVVLVGESNVGKSCLALRIAEDRYEEQGTTHGMKFWPISPQRLNGDQPIPEGQLREVVLWDMGG